MSEKTKTIKVTLSRQQMEIAAALGNALGMPLDEVVQYMVIRSLDDLLRSRLFGTRL